MKNEPTMHLRNAQHWSCGQRVHSVLNLFFGCTLLVSFVTHRVKVFEIPTKLYQHIDIPPTTRTTHNHYLLCGRSAVGLRKDVARTNMCIIPGTNLCSRLFWRGVQQVAVSCHEALAEKDHFFHERDHLCADEFAKRWTSCTTTLLFHSSTLSSGLPPSSLFLTP